MNRKWLIANIFFVSFVNGAVSFSAAGIMTDIFSKCGLELWSIAVLISIFGAGRFGCLLLPKVKADRYSLTLSLALMSLACIALSVFYNYFMLCAAFFAVGAGAYFVNETNSILIGRICVGRGDMLGLLQVFFSFGALASSALYAFFVYDGSGRQFFMTNSGVLAAIGALACFFGHIGRIPVNTLPHSRKRKKVHLDMSFFSGMILVFFFSGCEICAVFWFLHYFSLSGTMSVSNAVAVVSFMCFSVIMGRIVIGYLSEKKMQKEFVALICAVMAAIFCFMTLSDIDSRKIAFDASVFAFFMTGVYPLFSSVSSEISERGKYFKNLPLIAAGLGKMILPFAIGVCLYFFGARSFLPVMFFYAVACAAAVFAVVSKVVFVKWYKNAAK